MLQKEVVKRLCAGPNSKAYGRLTIMAQYFCQVMPVLEVPPSASVSYTHLDVYKRQPWVVSKSISTAKLALKDYLLWVNVRLRCV